MVPSYCLPVLSIPMSMEGHCPVKLETGELDFHCGYLQRGLVGQPLGQHVSWMAMLTHMYIPSSVLWKGSDLIVAAGKKHWRALRWVGSWRRSEWEFLHRCGKRAIDLDGREATWDSFLRDTKTWTSMYHTDFFHMMDSIHDLLPGEEPLAVLSISACVVPQAQNASCPRASASLRARTGRSILVAPYPKPLTNQRLRELNRAVKMSHIPLYLHEMTPSFSHRRSSYSIILVLYPCYIIY